jgi:hypothetical protein
MVNIVWDHSLVGEGRGEGIDMVGGLRLAGAENESGPPLVYQHSTRHKAGLQEVITGRQSDFYPEGAEAVDGEVSKQERRGDARQVGGRR